jgi:hypothetical protein
MEYTVEMTSVGVIHIPSFKTIGSGAQAIIRYCLKNFRGFMAGIADERDL